MGFSGGGSNVLKPHKHSSAAQDGSPLNMDNVTEASLTAGDIVYSDGSALQRLAIGSTTDSLVVSAGIPSWGAATSNPLIKVTKTFADIVVGTTSMDIYTLPVNAALVNVYTDITTPFDVSTAVTVGDAGDDNGFLEATNWTSGAGLTSATRGAYVTSFKTMRSVSGTTAIKAYNFSTTGGTGSTFVQNVEDDGRGMNNWERVEICQLYQTGHILVGESVCKASFWFKTLSGTPAGTVTAMIRESDGTLKAASTTFLDASTITASYAEYEFDFPSTAITADDMICLNTESLTGSYTIALNYDNSNMTNGEMWNKNLGGAYTQVDPAMVRQTVTYACTPLTSDTAGEVDFYLQVVD